MTFMLPPAETRLPWRAIVKGLLPSTADFSSTLREFLQVEQCIVTNSGRTALFLVLERLNRARDSKAAEVLLPGYTCYSVAAAVVKAGLRISVYDLDPRTLQPDFEDLGRKINANTLAILGQHLLGVRTDIPRLTELAHEHGICCIEDSAQLLEPGSAIPDHRTRADYAIFSFGRGKLLPLGGGGALIGRALGDLTQMSGALAASPRRLPQFVTPLVIRTLAHPRLYWLPEKLPLGLSQPVYDPSFCVAQMPAVYQRIGTVVLASLERFNQHRAAVGEIYDRAFRGQAESRQSLPSGPYPRYPLLVDDVADMGRVHAYGVRQIFPMPLADLPAIQPHVSNGSARLPGVREIADRLVTLPTHLSVNEKTAERIVRAVYSVFRSVETVT